MKATLIFFFAWSSRPLYSTDAAIKTGYAPVNGLKLYYEVYGTGQPLVLIHGGLGVASMFDPYCRNWPRRDR
jgi:hypothetical protein